jgi:hypothetical protein
VLRRLVVIVLAGLALVGQACLAFSGGDALHIALHDGFKGQTVTVTVDGRQVYHRAGVQTDLRISRADAFETETTGPQAQVEVTIEPGSQRAAMSVDVRSTPFLAIDVTGNAIRLTPSAEPFRYM